MQVRYLPASGEPDTVEAYGTTLKAGEWVEVDDRFGAKALGNPHFETKDEPEELQAQAKRQRGRPRKQAEGVDEAAVERERERARAEQDAVAVAENA